MRFLLIALPTVIPSPMDLPEASCAKVEAEPVLVSSAQIGWPLVAGRPDDSKVASGLLSQKTA